MLYDVAAKTSALDFRVDSETFSWNDYENRHVVAGADADSVGRARNNVEGSSEMCTSLVDSTQYRGTFAKHHKQH